MSTTKKDDANISPSKDDVITSPRLKNSGMAVLSKTPAPEGNLNLN